MTPNGMVAKGVFHVKGRGGTATPPPPQTVQLDRTKVDPTLHQALWTAIRCSTEAISWKHYQPFIDDIMCRHLSPTTLSQHEDPQHVGGRRGLPFPGVDNYLLLKVATEIFLMSRCGVLTTFRKRSNEELDLLRECMQDIDLSNEAERLGTRYDALQLVRRWRDYTRTGNANGIDTLPYYALIRLKLKDIPIKTRDLDAATNCFGLLQEKLTHPCFLELIWSYWHEEGMLVQSANAISMRFQNRRNGPGRDPLGELETDPLRPLNSVLWGYIQDEQHRLTVPRRVYEYDHHYGITLHGKAVPTIQSADSRSKFLEAYHRLLNLCSTFFTQDDDTTVKADGFPLLNGLKEVHLLLTQGQHNQYGDLPWNARLEMLMQEWLLARPEMREFLPGRIMVAYPEPWMDRVDSMKKLQGWTDTSVLHFRDLGVFGEQILLSIRFAPWNDVNDRYEAANWARYWRAEIQGYLHAYRAVTGVDLTLDRVDATPPSTHLRNRLAAQLRSA
jgi:hypothetical protein